MLLQKIKQALKEKRETSIFMKELGVSRKELRGRGSWLTGLGYERLQVPHVLPTEADMEVLQLPKHVTHDSLSKELPGRDRQESTATAEKFVQTHMFGRCSILDE